MGAATQICVGSRSACSIALFFFFGAAGCLFAQPTKLGTSRQSQAPPSTDPSRCVDYARKAVDSNAENLAKNCGFTGPLWSSDFNAHLSFCRSVPNKDFGNLVESRERQRAEMLTKTCRWLDVFVSDRTQTDETITLVGTGFTPNGEHQVTIDFIELPLQTPRQSGAENTTADGSFRTERTFTFKGAPVTCDPNEKARITVKATDKANGASVTATTQVSKCGALQ
jgi:hypothetical protein